MKHNAIKQRKPSKTRAKIDPAGFLNVFPESWRALTEMRLENVVLKGASTRRGTDDISSRELWDTAMGPLPFRIPSQCNATG